MNLLPKGREMLGDAAAVAARSYHYAKGAAEVGVDPDLASQWGQSVGNNGFWLFKYWVATFTIMFALGVFIFQGLFWIWAPVHLFGMWLLWKRYKEFRDTDPRIRLRYGLPTGRIVALLFAWFIGIFLLSAMVNFIIPIMTTTPKFPEPVVQTPQGRPASAPSVPSTVPTAAPYTPYVPPTAPAPTLAASPYSACAQGWSGPGCSTPTEGN